jgi:hypothetical protein
MAEEKTGWDKASIVLQPLGGFMTALAVAFLGFYGSNALSRNQERDTMRRAQADLVSQRETADTGLRKDMFTSIINQFLQPHSGSIDEQILRLELLAYNFHESIDLGPLFKDVYRKIDVRTGAGQGYLHRLEKVVKEVNGRELATLGQEGAATREAFVDFGQVAAHPEGVSFIADDKIGLHGSGCDHERTVDLRCRYFRVDVMEFNPQARELLVQLRVSPPGDPGGNPEVDRQLKVGFFDFPMIDNTRLSHSQRCALVLTRFDDAGAGLTLVYFPGFRAGLKDKLFVEEIVHNMIQDTPEHQSQE